MRPTFPSLLTRGALPLLLAVAAVLLWSGHTGRWDGTAWQTPDDYHGDPCEIFTRIQNAAEDPLQPLRGFPHSERLAAPFTADWSHYPIGDGPTFAAAGLLARSVGPYAAGAILAALLCAASAASFYACGRWLRWRPEWAAAGALLFAFTNYQQRWAVTLSFNQTWTLPPLLLLCAIAARRAPLAAHRQKRWGWIAALLGVWLGLGNPYFVFFTGALAAGTLVLAWFRRAPLPRLRLPLIFLVVMGVAVVLGHWSYFAGPSGAGAASSGRGFAAAEIYAFKPIELLIPPPDHRWWFLRDIGRIYGAAISTRGEPFYNYAGLAGLAGLLLLGASALRRRPFGRMPDAATGALFCGALTMVGGGNTLLAMAGLDWFRAGGRIGILFPLWGLLTLASVLNRWTRRAPRALGLAAALALVAIGWIDQTPLPGNPQNSVRTQAELAADRATAATLVQALGPAVRLFQLPYVPFPEAGRTAAMGDYEHFRPFLAHPALAISYGGLRGQSATAWASRLSRLPPQEMVTELNRAGFAALWIDRRGYTDQAEKLLVQLRALGLPEIPTSRTPEIVVFRLTPHASPVQPDLLDPRLQPEWNPLAAIDSDQPLPLALSGWYEMDRNAQRAWRWAVHSARLGLYWEGAVTEATVRFEADSRMPGHLAVRDGAKILWEGKLPGATAVPVQIRLPLRHGLLKLDFSFDGQPRRGPDPRLLGFHIAQLDVRLD